MKRFTILLGLFVPALAMGATVSEKSESAKVLGYIPYSQGSVEILIVNHAASQTPIACNTTRRYAMSSTNPRFAATRAAIVAAYHGQTPVRIKGAGTCAVWDNAEDINYVCIGETPC